MEIAASILSVDDRVSWVKKINESDISYLHVDVMDGKFVSNKQFSLEEIREIDKITMKKMDVHLMVEDPISYIEKLEGMKIEFITFHYEVGGDILAIIGAIRKLGYKVGMAIKPKTDISEILPYLSLVDMVLVMSVEPGYGGQQFIIDCYKKALELSLIIKERSLAVLLEMDGGINKETIGYLRKAGIKLAVVGGYIVGRDDYLERIRIILAE